MLDQYRWLWVYNMAGNSGPLDNGVSDEQFKI